MYLTTTPRWIRALYPKVLLWEGPVTAQPTVYLTFDDGPHSKITHFVLEELDRYGASATFFCIGKNVVENPGLFERLQRSRHSVGNHTFSHCNGWKTDKEAYLTDVEQAAAVIPSRLFRPPYGRIRPRQVRALLSAREPYTIAMWSVLSGDFDTALTPQACLENVVFHAKPRSIIVFHDSLKAAPRLEYVLPRVLAHFSRKGWKMEALAMSGTHPHNF